MKQRYVTQNKQNMAKKKTKAEPDRTFSAAATVVAAAVVVEAVVVGVAVIVGVGMVVPVAP